MWQLAQEIKQIVEDVAKYPDFSSREDLKAQLKVHIILKLSQYKYPPITQEDVYKEVLEQAENFKRNN